MSTTMGDRILARELVGYAKTDRLLEWQRLIPWINNFAAKKAKGRFNRALGEKALGDYLMRATLVAYQGPVSNIRLDAATKLLFGRMMLTYLMPRIDRVAKRMRAVGVMKGKLVKEHPMREGRR